MTKRNICPVCEKKTTIEHVYKKEKFIIKGEEIFVPSEYYKCLECGSDFQNTRTNVDSLDIAYREYRKRKNLMQPEEIKKLRKQYGLTQQELSTILGWGMATLSRYENGALQDSAHNNMLVLITDPRNLKDLILKNGEFLPLPKKEKILRDIEESIEEAYSFQNFYSEKFGRYKESIMSGYRKLDLAKLFEVIKLFCHGKGVFKTKLLKLLFYADFKYFKEFSVSITGVRYAHANYGPIPDKHEFYLATMNELDFLDFEEKIFDNYCGEELISNSEINYSLFTESELKIVLYVKDFFKHHTANEIKEYSHKEPGYMETENGDLISYAYADQLSI